MFLAPVKEVTEQPKADPEANKRTPGANKDSKPVETPKTETHNQVPELSLGSLTDLMAGNPDPDPNPNPYPNPLPQP